MEGGHYYYYHEENKNKTCGFQIVSLIEKGFVTVWEYIGKKDNLSPR